MANVFKKIAGFKANRGQKANRKKEQQRSNRYAFANKERDKLLHEFLLAREELRSQFEREKREIVDNYERRILYLRRLLEECEENMDMLKLNLTAERGEKMTLKNDLKQLKQRNQSKKGNNPQKNFGSLSSFQMSEEDSMSGGDVVSLTSQENSPLTSSRMPGGSNRKTSTVGSMSLSVMTSPGTTNSSHSDSSTGDSNHKNCRKEFNRLLKELRAQQVQMDSRLKEEKELLRDQFENEKLQLERVVYRQLNVRIEREMKKQELLLTENTHLRRTISNTILERLNSYKNASSQESWKESNSDSGAEIEDNRSDDSSDVTYPDSGKSSLSDRYAGIIHNEHIYKEVISKIIETSQEIPIGFKSVADRDKVVGKKILNSENELAILMNENCSLKDEITYEKNCKQEYLKFYEELKHKLVVLEDVLKNSSSDRVKEV